MRVQKLLLIIVTGALTVILLFVGLVNYLIELEYDTASTAVLFLGCTGVFSLYFHMKTKEMYPFSEFEAPLEELSKKYWALHIAFGLTLICLGSYITVFSFTETIEMPVIGIFGSLTIIGIWTLLDVYFLHKFIVSYKKRLQQRDEIENISGIDS